MKFSILIAVAAAIQTPNVSYAAKRKSLDEVNATVETQKIRMADHLKRHEAAMDEADNDCETQKNMVRRARDAQVKGGN